MTPNTGTLRDACNPEAVAYNARLRCAGKIDVLLSLADHVLVGQVNTFPFG